VPVGHGEVRRAWVVVCCLGYSRAGAGALIFSKEAPDVLWGMSRCLFSLGALAKLMVWDREGCLHAGGGRPTDAYAAFCGQLLLDWYFCEAADPQAKGVVERLQGYLETNFEPGRRFANHLDFQLQLDAWFQKANARAHKMLRARPVDNAWNYVKNQSLRELLSARQIKHLRTQAYRPQTNGKVERFHQTMAREWAYGMTYRSHHHRSRALPHWLEHYNTRRPHSGIGNRPPLSRVHNLCGQDI